MSVLIIPPTVLIFLFSKPVLLIWIGDENTAKALLDLTIMVLGGMFSSCAYPSLSILYSRKSVNAGCNFKPNLCDWIGSIAVFVCLLFRHYWSSMGDLWFILLS